jgi:carbonic anhydrase/acetyltransferase-like protein (isoleucine patch superfamily)
MTIYKLGASSPDLPTGTSCWIAPSAIVLGKVRLHHNASVWFGAVLRGDLELILVGEGSNIQDNAVLHTDTGYPLTIGRNCTIGHRAMLHGCTIGDNTLIGIGATILDGAQIGANCIIGAHALITEGKVIPDNSLAIGSPGKIARELSAEDITGIAHAAAHYIENCKRFSAEIFKLG